ncbi:SDR family NAD(P)-dependent oxidoreductase [Amycolatopsis sp. cmx-4-61]|uniref:SDR family NAD(P)-dependent oxidoreductase n=1 Tax=Amycolatopsis sp. cmx-4-61 TaxID=2790937 RepID=UPI003979A972
MRALVTGAGRGIGLAVCRHLADAGFEVVASARRLADAEAAGTGRAVRLDVTDAGSVAAALEQAGPVDILVNNAGVLLDAGAPPESVPPELVAETVAVNALGALRVSQAVLPGMFDRGWGRIVMVSSGTGAFSHGLFTGAPAYALSKTALNAVTVLLANSARGRGVLVNAVNPGRVRTRMMPEADGDPAAAAADIAWAATLPDDGPTGTFFRSREPIDW